MNIRWKQGLVMMLLAGVAAAGFTGCVALAAGAAAGAGTVSYIRGEYVENFPSTTDKVRNTLQGAAREQRLAFINERIEGDKQIMTFRDEADDKWVITIVPLTTNSSQIRIRVGVLGDEAKSRAFADRVKRILLM